MMYMRINISILKDERIISSFSKMESSDSHQHVHDPNRVKLWRWMRVYTAYVYRRPYVPITISLLVTLGLFFWLYFAYGINPACNTNYYRWSGDEISNKWDAYVGASKNTYGSLLGMLGETITMLKQFQLTQMGCIIYERANDNMLSAEAVQEVWKMEDLMHQTEGWGDYCFKVPLDSLPQFAQNIARQVIESMKDILSALEEDTKCIAFKSLITELKEFLQTRYNVTNPQPEDLSEELLADFIWGDNRTREDRVIQTYFGSDYDPDARTTTRMRSMFPFGLPIKGYRNKGDRQAEQTAKLGKWQQGFLQPMRDMSKAKPKGVIPYGGFPFALNYDISDLILKQVWWLVGSFLFMFVFAVFVMKSFFVAILGTIGVFLPIPCALAIVNIVFQIHHIDVINVIALFLICGIGADCLFIIFELFRQSETIYTNHKKRLAYASQRGLIALATSITTSGVSFLALCTSGVRIMNFFGIFSFLLLLFTFIFTFTWYIGILAIWAKHWEHTGLGCSCNCKCKCKKRKRDELESLNSKLLMSQSSTLTFTDSSSSGFNDLYVEYPKNGIFDFLHGKPEFKIDAAGIDISRYNVYEKFFYNYMSPVIYYYRLPIVVLAFAFAAIMAYFTFQMETKSELQFLPDDHQLQRAYTLALNGFSTALNDFSFVYVWGIDPKPIVKVADKLTIDNYGIPTYWPFNITDQRVQQHINNTWNLILSKSFIDKFTTTNFGVNPWNIWEQIVDFDEEYIEDPLIGPLIKIAFEYLNLTKPPESMEYITPEEYSGYSAVWQILLSELAYQEPDSYVPGTLKANTVGFSLDDYSLQFIGMKANMFIPSEITIESLHELYDKAKKLEQEIHDDAERLGIPEFKGFMTGVAWLTMVTEEKLPQQVIKDVGYAFIFASVVILISTFSISYTLYVLVSMLSTIFMILGILDLTGWKIGTNEAIMISIASGFCADFIIQPMLALAHDSSERSLYGKIQASLTTFCTPVSCALVTTLVAACFLYPCDILLFPPFATFLLGSGIFGIVHGFIILPALVALISCGKTHIDLYSLPKIQQNKIIPPDSEEDIIPEPNENIN
ncbi:hypothetical protein TRFO_02231 [Tritrichomonas foetus]|uniref:SSD domain-containing protein n=1 Tax=Tritrichomonas foetus TaxID=1144522 RepID=A0A1J4J7X6_9EUKA|nr:hypothetical protein TRFO_02231 [Tritrichomonas foetus]|eukprot:OHS95248.1 hypothetical protein TRFO_02231 [Tritrichomonas foetus]